MAAVTLFHSVCGLRPAVLADAERLRAAGHTVSTPDLFEGVTFDDIDSGMAHVRSLGGGAEVEARARAAVADGAPGHVYGGYSIGASIAQSIIESRPDAGGGLFLAHADKPWEIDRWTVPTQAHVARSDEWVDDAAGAAAAGIEVFEYDGGHLFMDPDLDGYDAASTELLWERVVAFLARLG